MSAAGLKLKCQIPVVIDPVKQNMSLMCTGRNKQEHDNGF